MKIAVAQEGTKVSGHFGHCEGFTLFDAKDGKITSKTYLPSPGHKPGLLPAFLFEQGANVIISGGMGAGAVELFAQKGIKVAAGVQGDAEEVVRQYLAGTLKATGEVCHEHQHAGECGH